MAKSALAMKLLKERCLECSICAIFFNSSLTVSIRALFLSKNCHFLLYLNKTVVGDDLGKQMPEINAYLILIEMLQAAIAGGVEHIIIVMTYAMERRPSR